MLAASLLLATLLSADAESDTTIPLPQVWEKIPLPEVLDPKPLRPPAIATDGTSDDRYAPSDDRYGTLDDRYASGNPADRYAAPFDAPTTDPAAPPAGPIIEPPKPAVDPPAKLAPSIVEPEHRTAPRIEPTKAAAPPELEPDPGSVSLPEKVDAFKQPTWPVAPASAIEPTAPAPTAEASKPWLPLAVSLLALAASLAANVYLGWVWLGTRQQYRELVARGLRPGGESLS